jgi:organic hydroperoxide reductase OsmC/OhrA
VMTIHATFRTIPGTQAAEGVIDDHAVVVDRPAGVAGGAGMGLNGGQLLALSIGGCLANDVRYVAAEQGVEVDDVVVDVDLDIADGRVVGAVVRVEVAASDGVDTADLVARAEDVSTILAAVRSGFPAIVNP